MVIKAGLGKNASREPAQIREKPEQLASHRLSGLQSATMIVAYQMPFRPSAISAPNHLCFLQATAQCPELWRQHLNISVPRLSMDSSRCQGHDSAHISAADASPACWIF
jgi:hypothetical protein